MNALEELINEVREGWSVEITDHDYLNDSRDNVTVTSVREDGVTLTPRKPWSSQGRRFSTTTLEWDSPIKVEGRTVRLYRTPPRHTGKARQLVKTYIFTPPPGY